MREAPRASSYSPRVVSTEPWMCNASSLRNTSSLSISGKAFAHNACHGGSRMGDGVACRFKVGLTRSDAEAGLLWAGRDHGGNSFTVELASRLHPPRPLRAA